MEVMMVAVWLSVLIVVAAGVSGWESETETFDGFAVLIGCLEVGGGGGLSLDGVLREPVGLHFCGDHESDQSVFLAILADAGVLDLGFCLVDAVPVLDGGFCYGA
jgi:hypothetical protein